MPLESPASTHRLALLLVAAALAVATLVPAAEAYHRNVQGQFGIDAYFDWLDGAPAPEGDLAGVTLVPFGGSVFIGLPGQDRVLVYGHDNDAEHLQPSLEIAAPAGAPARFGRSVAVGAAGLVVAAGEGADAALYLYPWGLEQVSTSPQPLTVPPHAGLDFGRTMVAAEERSDDPTLRMLAVGAPALAATGKGAVFVLRSDATGTWRLEARIDGSTPGFGSEVATDSRLLAVGAPSLDKAASGTVTLYDHGASGKGTAWKMVQELAPPRTMPGFGTAVALDYLRLLVGAPATDGQGSAFLFTATDYAGKLAPEGEAIPPGEERLPTYGQDVTMEGNYGIVAAPSYGSNGGAIFRFQGATLVGRAGAPGEPGAGVFAEHLVQGFAFRVLVTYRSTSPGACPFLFELGAVDPAVGPWPDPCLAPAGGAPATGGDTAASPRHAATGRARPRESPTAAGATLALVLVAAVALRRAGRSD